MLRGLCLLVTGEGHAAALCQEPRAQRRGANGVCEEVVKSQAETLARPIRTQAETGTDTQQGRGLYSPLPGTTALARRPQVPPQYPTCAGDQQEA